MITQPDAQAFNRSCDNRNTFLHTSNPVVIFRVIGFHELVKMKYCAYTGNIIISLQCTLRPLVRKASTGPDGSAFQCRETGDDIKQFFIYPALPLLMIIQRQGFKNIPNIFFCALHSESLPIVAMLKSIEINSTIRHINRPKTITTSSLIPE